MSDFRPQRQKLPVPGEKNIFGLYEGPIDDTTTNDWDTTKTLFSRRRAERKAWIFLGVFSRDLYAGVAIIDAGYLASAFSYIYIPSERYFVEDRQVFPLGMQTDFAATLGDTWRLGSYEILPTEKNIVCNVRGKFDFSATFVRNDSGLSTIAPSDHLRPFHFTYKEMALQVKGEFIDKRCRQKFEGEVGVLDYSKGYPPRRTEWNWLSMVGKTESGKSLAVNLVDKFNEGIENAYWLDGKPHSMVGAHFHYIKPAEKSIWRITTKDNQFEARFRPFGARHENLNVGLVRSRFVQPYGIFDGQIQINGVMEKFSGYGVTEDHFALW